MSRLGISGIALPAIAHKLPLPVVWLPQPTSEGAVGAGPADRGVVVRAHSGAWPIGQRTGELAMLGPPSSLDSALNFEFFHPFP